MRPEDRGALGRLRPLQPPLRRAADRPRHDPPAAHRRPRPGARTDPDRPGGRRRGGAAHRPRQRSDRGRRGARAARRRSPIAVGFPQTAMRNDRLSAIEQWDLGGQAAVANEIERGLATIASGETREGSARFAAGAGRHGAPSPGKTRGLNGALTRAPIPLSPAKADARARQWRKTTTNVSQGSGARSPRRAEPAERGEPRRRRTRTRPPKGDSGMSLGMRAGSEFVSAIIVGAGIGWGLDRLLGTNPLLPDRVLLPRRRGRRLERDPADFAERRGSGPKFALVSYGSGG